MPDKIKILFTIPNFDTAGSGKSVYDMVNGLNKDRFDPEICIFHTKGELYKRIESLGVKIHVFPFTADYRPFISLPFRILKIYRFFKAHKFDLIHSWHWSSDFTEPLAAKMVGIPFVYTKKAMGFGNKAWKWRSRLSSRIVVVNGEMKSAYFQNMSDKVVQIPLCVDTKHFSALPRSYESPEGIKLQKDEFIIVSVANLVAVKGIEILLEAVRQINNKKIRVFIVGDDNNDYGMDLKEKYASDGNFFFMGKHLDVRPYLAMADVFVIPTKDEGRREGLPIAPMEAMSSQRIVIGSNITGIREVLKEFPQLQFEPGNYEKLADKIRYVMSLNSDEKLALENEMRHYVKKALSIEIFVKEHEKLFLEIVSDK